MKTLVCFILAFQISFGYAFGKIRNGYTRLDECKKSLQIIQLQLTEVKGLSKLKQRRLRAIITSLANYILYYELTEQLLAQLMTISPGLYIEMDNLKDKRGRPTDVYVKLIPKEQAIMPLEGAAYFSQASIDEDANNSKYGEYSVSVEINIVHKALQFLYHELGHVSYVVPNLAAYKKFYCAYYSDTNIDPAKIGHNPYDVSGKFASLYEDRFRKDYTKYLKDGGLPFNSMLALMQTKRKNNRYPPHDQMMIVWKDENLVPIKSEFR